MADTRLTPIAGMNNVAEDAALQVSGESARTFVRDAVNVNVSQAGKIDLRASPILVSSSRFRAVWQSPLHGDTFGAIGDQWGRIDPSTWALEPLATIGDGDVSHEVLDSLVCVAGPAGIFSFDGTTARRMAIDQPARPMVIPASGSMPAGTYGVAVSWLRGAIESSPSAISFVDVADQGGLEVTLPLNLDASVTGARLYLTRQNGGELGRAGDYPVGYPTINLPLLPDLGMPPQFLNKSPMPTGKFLRYWRGRLITARANVLRFSESMAYHLHDERYGYVQMPQRITFLEPVDGGIWVGQVDHVAFLEGATPDSLSRQRKTSRAPVPGSSIQVSAETVGGDLSSGGAAAVMWLAENGYVIGTASGQVVELHAGVIKGITAGAGTSVVLDRRAITVVT